LQIETYPVVLCVVPARLQRVVLRIVTEKQPLTTYCVKSWESFLQGDILSGWQTARQMAPIDLLGVVNGG
jgi:hypothetical protein